MSKRRKRTNQMSFDFSSLKFDFADPDREQVTEATHVSTAPVMFENAEQLVKELDITKDCFCLVNGSFIFGDIFEALCLHKKLKPSAMYITTLGMNEENIDSLVNCTRYLGCERIKLLTSNYFASMERRKRIPYMEKEFAGEPIDVAIVSAHCKIALIRSEVCDLLITGSANLSSCDAVEQFTIMHDPAVMDFVQRKLDAIFDRFTVYRGEEQERTWENNKGNRVRPAWEVLKNS